MFYSKKNYLKYLREKLKKNNVGSTDFAERGTEYLNWQNIECKTLSHRIKFLEMFFKTIKV
ncbi:MAG: hypothetical protein ACFFDF_19035 [Candidatus Odinarchaeota archaeon]